MTITTRSGFAAIALSLSVSAPAYAGWETTRWGMSPKESIAVLDGAVEHAPAGNEIYEQGGKKYAPLVKLSREIEGVPGQLSLLFDTDETLRFVMFNPADVAACDALGAALAERYGAADAVGAGAISISDWVDGAEVIKLTKVGSSVCNLSYSAN